MERDSFIFYRSFYDAVRELPKDIKLEVLTAIIEYALFGRDPDALKPFAKGMFTLIKPNIDANTARYVGGQKGAQSGKRGGRPKKNSPSTDSDYSLSYEQEIEAMRSDEDWRKKICNDFNISADELESRISRFLAHCKEEGKRKGRTGHSSAEDARSHLRYWLSKAIQHPKAATLSVPKNENDSDVTPPPPDYSYRGFGSVDS